MFCTVHPWLHDSQTSREPYSEVCGRHQHHRLHYIQPWEFISGGNQQSCRMVYREQSAQSVNGWFCKMINKLPLYLVRKISWFGYMVGSCPEVSLVISIDFTLTVIETLSWTEVTGSAAVSTCDSANIPSTSQNEGRVIKHAMLSSFVAISSWYNMTMSQDECLKHVTTISEWKMNEC